MVRRLLTFHLRGIGSQAAATTYWGSQEGLTFTERWKNDKTVERPIEGINKVSLTNIEEDSPLYVRILLRNSSGQFWTSDTFIDGR